MCRSLSEKDEGQESRSLSRTGDRGTHGLLSAVVSHAETCIKPALKAGTRGAKKPRSDYLGGRAEVSHLLLGGRAGRKAYKQRVQVEDEFCRCFLPIERVSGKI